MQYQQRIIRNIGYISLIFLLCSEVSSYYLGPEHRITSTPSASWMPDVAVNGSTIHVTWLDYYDVTDSEVYYIRSNNAGITWETPKILTQNQYQEYDPDLLCDGNKLYVVFSAYRQGFENQTEIMMVSSMDSGYSWGSEVRITNTPGDSSAAKISKSSDQCLNMVWSDQSIGWRQTFITRSCDQGTTWALPSMAARSYENLDSEEPELITNTLGDYLIFMRDNRLGYPHGGWPPYSIMMIRSIDQGASWIFPPLMISHTLPDVDINTYDKSVYVDSNNAIHVTWWGNLNGSNVFYRRSSDGGYTWSEIAQLSDFPGDHPMHEIWLYGAPKITERLPGELWCVFNSHWNIGLETARRRGDLYLCNSTDGGTTWSKQQQVTSSGRARDPRIFRISENKLGLIWMDERDDVRPEHPNWGDELYFRTVEFDYQEDHAPKILGAGWWKSSISQEDGGILQLLALVIDPDGFDDIERVELAYDGIPLGFELIPGGGSLGFDPSSGVFGLEFPVQPDALKQGFFSIEILARDHQNNSVRWPSLEIFNEEGIAPYTHSSWIPGIPVPENERIPNILLGGYWDTRLTESKSSVLTIVAFIETDGGRNKPVRVEVAYQGIGTGIFLNDDGSAGGTGDAAPGDMLYTWKTAFPENSLAGFSGTYPLTIIVEGKNGNFNEWPFLAIWE